MIKTLIFIYKKHNKIQTDNRIYGLTEPINSSSSSNDTFSKAFSAALIAVSKKKNNIFFISPRIHSSERTKRFQ